MSVVRDPSLGVPIERSSSLARSLQNDGEAPEDRKGKKANPENLLMFGEVLEERGPDLKVVAEARKGLKKILTSHLGAQAQHDDKYPVARDERTGQIVYRARINSQEEKAFNQQAQQRLAVAASQIEKFLFRHQYEFGIVGGALDKTRQSGIMPPNLFRWMRFSERSMPLWWFVHNLGMPSAVPENAALFEHYGLEALTKTPVEKPFIRSALTGLVREAGRYLTEETIEDLARILGRGAVIDEAVRNCKIARMVNQQTRDTLGFLSDEVIRSAQRANGNPAPEASQTALGDGEGGTGLLERERPQSKPERAPTSFVDDLLGDMIDAVERKRDQ